MKQKLHIFMTLLLLLVCGGASFGQTTVTFVNGTDASSGSTLSKDGVTLKVTGGTFDSATAYYRCNSGATMTISCADGKITKIEFECTASGTSKGGPGGFKNDNYSYSGTKGTWTGSSESVSLTASNNQVRMSKVTVTYVGSKTSTKLSFGEGYDGKTISTKVGEMLETPATLTPAVAGATITYSSSDKTVAEIDKDGIVYAYKEGTTTITASYDGDDTYAASKASYTLNVVDGRTATTLTFPNASYTFGQGDQNGTAVIEDNAAVLTPEDAGKVTYSITGTDGLADVMEDGSVLVNTYVVGTATVTASFAGNDNYKASGSSYTITVKELKEAFDLTNPAAYGYAKPGTSKATDVAVGKTLVLGDVTITNVKDGTANTRFFNNSSNKITFRVYRSAQLLISVPNGYAINGITTSPNTEKYSLTGLNTNKVTMDVTDGINFTAMTVTYAKLPTETLTTAASGFATYAADYDVNYSDAGLTAYAITLDEANKTVKYTEATGVVPAGKAVLVKGEAQKGYTLTPATEDADDFTTDLQVSDGKVTSANGLYYVFATVNGKSGFKILADGMTIPAKKGYLKLSTASAKSFFELEGGEATGISEIEAEAANDNAAIYNLAGQRVSKSYKGIAIKNGKKFVK